MSAVENRLGAAVTEARRITDKVGAFEALTDLALGKGSPSIDKKRVAIDVSGAEWHHGYFGRSDVSRHTANDDELRWIREAVKQMASSIIARAIGIGEAEVARKTLAARADAEAILAALEGSS